MRSAHINRILFQERFFPMRTSHIQKLTIAAAVVFPVVTSLLHADGLDAQKGQVFSTKVSQEEIQASTAKLGAEVAKLLEELRSNNLDNKDAARAESTLAQLTGVSKTEMEAVLRNLALAEKSNAANEFQQHVVGAIGEQTRASARLLQLANSLLARQSVDSLPSRIEAALQRQTLNIQQTEAATVTGVTKRQQQTAANSLEAAKFLQAGLADDLVALGETFTQIETGTPEGSASPAGKAAALFKSRSLAQRAIEARDQLNGGDLQASLSSQNAILNGLSALLAATQDPASRAQALQRLQEESKQLAGAQQRLAADTNEVKPGMRDKLVEPQRALAARTEALAKRLIALDPEAGKHAEDAVQKMGESIDLLTARKADLATTAATQSAAAELLAKTTASLAQAAAQPASEKTASQAYDALKQIDQKLADAQAAQAAIDAAKSGSAPAPALAQKQEEVAKAVEAMQSAVAPMSASAAQSLAEAADKMASSSTSGEAAPSLAEAKAEVQKALAELAPAAAEAKAKEAEEEALKKIASEIAKASELAEKAVESLPTSTSTAKSNAAADAAMAFADARNATAQAAQKAAAAAAGVPTASPAPSPASTTPSASQAPSTAASSSAAAPSKAAAALAKATASLAEAMKQAGSGNSSAAAQAAKAAQAQLAEAKSAVSPPSSSTASSSSSSSGSPSSSSSSSSSASSSSSSGSPGEGGSSSEGGSGGGATTGSTATATSVNPNAEAAPLVDLTNAKGSAITYANVDAQLNSGSAVAATLKPSERSSLAALQKETPPKGYEAKVEQYYLNLADSQEQRISP